MTKKSKNDISNKTVMVMLILVILVSSLCLGVYMNAVNNARMTSTQSTQSADLSITIDRPANTTPVDAGAEMTINIEGNGSEESVDSE